MATQQRIADVVECGPPLNTHSTDWDLLVAGVEDLPGRKQELVLKLFGEVAPLVARLDAELRKQDPKQFHELVEQAKRRLLAIEPHLIALEQLTKSEYTSLPVSLRVWLWLFSFLSSRARKDRLMWTKRRQRRSALLAAVLGYRDLLARWREQINEADVSMIRQKRALILGRHERYQRLLKEIRETQEAYNRFGRSADYYRLLKLRQERKSIEDLAFQEASAELGDEA
ncbi:MAG: hypothetical protein IT405_00920 [Candidatus Yanofskybacteria bacterium]|nr:hypothetical protein [Candidatus Yanofskybacteria bacterium]